jgi:MoxR-like ATPase
VKRRCIYHWIDYPTVEREIEILHKKAPDTSEILSKELAVAMHKLRELDLFKPPGVAETIDWAKAIQVLGEVELSADVVDATLGVIVKYEEDMQTVRSVGTESLV